VFSTAWVSLPGDWHLPAEAVQYWNVNAFTVAVEDTRKLNVFPVFKPFVPVFGPAYVELPEPSVYAQPGDELDSVKLRSVSGFKASADTAAGTRAGMTEVPIPANRPTAPSRADPRFTATLNLYIMYFLLCWFLFLLGTLGIVSSGIFNHKRLIHRKLEAANYSLDRIRSPTR
jgi:hypothetical protein